MTINFLEEVNQIYKTIDDSWLFAPKNCWHFDDAIADSDTTSTLDCICPTEQKAVSSPELMIEVR